MVGSRIVDTLGTTGYGKHGDKPFICEGDVSLYRFTTSKWNKVTVKMYNGQVFLCVQMGTYLIFLQLLLFYEEILLEKYPVWQLTMLSHLVVK